MPPTFNKPFVHLNDILSLLKIKYPSFPSNKTEITNRRKFTTMLLYPIPFTPRFAEILSVETKNVSKIMHRTSFAPVKIYTYLDLPSVIRHTSRKLAISVKMFAMLSILI